MLSVSVKSPVLVRSYESGRPELMWAQDLNPVPLRLRAAPSPGPGRRPSPAVCALSKTKGALHRNAAPEGTGGGGPQAEEGISLHPAQILGPNTQHSLAFSLHSLG